MVRTLQPDAHPPATGEDREGIGAVASTPFDSAQGPRSGTTLSYRDALSNHPPAPSLAKEGELLDGLEGACSPPVSGGAGGGKVLSAHGFWCAP